MPKNDEEWKAVGDWTNEVRNLRRVAQLKHPNILRFVTAFRRGEEERWEHYLLCEWALKGNLQEMWEGLKKPTLTPAFVKEITIQLAGLADAICTAHYPSDKEVGILHGDLKPANILCFPGDDKSGGGGSSYFGTLKIGDWGMGKLTPGDTRLMKAVTATGRASVLYEPPETETGVIVKGLGKPLKKRTRLYDVWAMGCIILEFIVWMLEGSSGLEQYYLDIAGRQRDKPYYAMRGSLGGEKPELRQAVVDKIEKLAKNPQCQPGRALGDLLELVRTDLLVVRLPKELASRDTEVPKPGKANTIVRDPSPEREIYEPSESLLAPAQEPIIRSPTFDTAAGISLEVTNYDDAEETPPLRAEGLVPRSTGHDPGHFANPKPASESSVESDIDSKPTSDTRKTAEEDTEPCRARADEMKIKLELLTHWGRERVAYWLTETLAVQGIQFDEVEGEGQEQGRSHSSASSSIDSGGTRFDSGRGARFDSGTTYVASGGSARSQAVGASTSDFLGIEKQQNVGHSSDPVPFLIAGTAMELMLTISRR